MIDHAKTHDSGNREPLLLYLARLTDRRCPPNFVAVRSVPYLWDLGHSMSDQRVFCKDLLRFAFNLACLLTFNIINKNANFQLCKSSAFRDMTLTNMGKKSFFALTQHIKIIITLVLVGAESWLTALFKALIQL